MFYLYLHQYFFEPRVGRGWDENGNGLLDDFTLATPSLYMGRVAKIVAQA
jgi:hypothetical protein